MWAIPGHRSGPHRVVKHRAVGRDYSSIHRTAWTGCSIGETNEQAQALVPEWMRALLSGSPLSSALIGSPETIRQRLAAYEAAGVQELVIHFDVTHLETARRFAREFIG